MNFRSLGSLRKANVYYTILYCGKPKEITDSYIGDTFTLVERIVDRYERNGYSLRGTNISMNRYYTSIPLDKWLYTKNVTCIGTIQIKWKGLPTELKETKKDAKKIVGFHVGNRAAQ